MNEEIKAVVAKTVTMKKGLPSAEQMGIMLTEETNRQRVLDKFIQENFKADQDYGIIPGTKKPTLLKPGAEKTLSLFNIRAEWTKDSDTLEMINKPGAVAFKCQLINRATNLVVGEGRGVALPMEKSSWTANTQVKICEKRALVDAVLVTFGLSSRYTQDMEDIPRGSFQNQPVRAQTRPVAQSNPDSLITAKQVDFIRRLLKDTGRTELSLMKNPATAKYQFLEKIPFILASSIIERLLADKETRKRKQQQDDCPTIDAETGEVVDDTIEEGTIINPDI